MLPLCMDKPTVQPTARHQTLSDAALRRAKFSKRMLKSGCLCNVSTSGSARSRGDQGWVDDWLPPGNLSENVPSSVFEPRGLAIGR